jgi:formylmethanofuran dehydrogenase subunit E
MEGGTPMISLDEFLSRSAALHKHLCPRQVLGVRMGILASDRLDLSLPQANKRLLTFVETDGCFADGVAVATGCWIGHRTLRVLDFGKVAATFVDTRSNTALRVHPHPQARECARSFAPGARNRWEGYLIGYQQMPVEELLISEPVTLSQSIEQLLSKPSARAICQVCGEEILNERELIHEGSVLCLPCAGERYYRVKAEEQLVTIEEDRSIET